MDDFRLVAWPHQDLFDVLKQPDNLSRLVTESITVADPNEPWNLGYVTVVFWNPNNNRPFERIQYQIERYATLEQAVAGHEKWKKIYHMVDR